MMNYTSTRSDEQVSASYAILHGLAQDGGLYVPTKTPQIDVKAFIGCTYQEIALKLLELYFDEFSSKNLGDAITASYNNEKFSIDTITNLHSLNKQESILELFYGPTLAFKDQALSLYPQLLLLAKEKQQNENTIYILTATSGDTGKAAMEAVKDISGIEIIVFYPTDGVSQIQKMQMQKQLGTNIHPIAIKGNFDDAQTAVKQIFADRSINEIALKHHNTLSSANSINIARFLPQVIYYVDAYIRLVEQNDITLGDEISVCVPTGNFGNILAAYLAKKMGLPIKNIICATNENNVLTDFINTGTYDISGRDFILTHSPSMDILISSNLERFLYFVLEDKQKIVTYMDELKTKQKFTLTDEDFKKLQAEIISFSTTNDETLVTINNVYQEYDYLIDPHTSVAISATNQYIKVCNPKEFILTVSTANPYKFIDCYKAIFAISETDDFAIMKAIATITKTSIPKNISDLETMAVRFEKIIDVADITKIVTDLLQSK